MIRLDRQQLASARVSAAAGMAILVPWLVFRPYRGIVHDARLYLHAMAYGEDPAFLHSDLLLAHDQQMGRTVYVGILRWVGSFTDLAGTAIMATVAGIASWIVGYACLARQFFAERWWIAAAAIAAMYAHWGPFFTFAEPFASPRAVSEAFVLMGISAVVAKRYGYAIAALLAALLLHPLVAVGGVGVAAVLYVVGRRAATLALGVLSVLGVVFVAIDPMGLAGPSGFDPEWLSIIRARAGVVFPELWTTRTWLAISSSFAIALLGARASVNEALRKFAGATAVVSAVGLALSLAFSWVWVSALITQVQPWRVLWLLHIASLTVVVGFVMDAAQLRERVRIVRAVTAGILLVAPSFVSLPGWMALFVLCLPVILGWRAAIDARSYFAVVVAVAGALAVAQMMYGVVGLVDIGPAANIDRWMVPSVLPALAPVVAVATVGLAFTSRRPDKWGIASTFVLGLALVVSIVGWDVRSDWESASESLTDPLVALPPDAVLLVEDDVGINPVHLLSRPSFYNQMAASGVVFSRDLAIAFEEAKEAAWSIGSPWAGPTRATEPIAAEEWIAPDASDVLALCARPSGPTHLLLRRPVPGHTGIVWESPVEIETASGSENPAIQDNGFVLYACEGFQ